MEQEHVIFHLSLIDGIGSGTINHIVDTLQATQIDLSALYQMTVAEMVNNCRISLQRAENMATGLSDDKLLAHELSLIERHDINWMTLLHDDYPTYLKAIHVPPALVYWQGAPLVRDEAAIAVIGSRRVNYYGMSLIEQFVPPLVRAGWTIVSGGAIGADSKAHAVTLDVGGRTIAVLGSGLRNPYPASNKRLFERIIAHGGTVLSSFPLTMQVRPGNFPARNRIIAGLCRGCLVVQAAARSGTHITAQFALDQGRELFAIPGPINDPLSAGCHSLIQQGAKLVHTVDDIFDELPMHGMRSIAQSASSQHAVMSDETPAGVILRACVQPCTIDELAEATGLSAQELYTQIFLLEVAGSLRRQGNGTWERL